MATNAKKGDGLDNLPTYQSPVLKSVVDSDIVATHEHDEILDASDNREGGEVRGTTTDSGAKDAVVDDQRVGGVTATPVKKGRPKKEEAPGAPKKKKPKKKGLVSASPSLDSGPRYYYDIQNFIVTNGVDLEQFGISSPPAATQKTQNGIRSEAPPPMPVKKEEVIAPVGTIEQTDYDELDWYTYPNGKKIPHGSVFCPECGMRIIKHKQKSGMKGGRAVEFFLCPDV